MRLPSLTLCVYVCVSVQIKNNVSQHLALLKALFFHSLGLPFNTVQEYLLVIRIETKRPETYKHPHTLERRKKPRKNDVYFVASEREKKEEHGKMRKRKMMTMMVMARWWWWRSRGNAVRQHTHTYIFIHISHSINEFCLCNKLARWWRGKSECDNTHMHKPRNTYSSEQNYTSHREEDVAL